MTVISEAIRGYFYLLDVLMCTVEQCVHYLYYVSFDQHSLFEFDLLWSKRSIMISTFLASLHHLIQSSTYIHDLLCIFVFFFTRKKVTLSIAKAIKNVIFLSLL